VGLKDSEAILSCPGCYRQYAVKRELTGKIGRCKFCDCYFMIDIAVPRGNVEDAILIDREVAYHPDFFREGCAELARNAADLLKLAGSPVWPENIKAFIASMPRTVDEARSEFWKDKPFTRFMKDANRRHPKDARYFEIFHYFIEYLPSRRLCAFNILQEAFAAVLLIEFDRPMSTELAVIPKPPVARRRRFDRLWKAVGL
jgi:hypothetical protein